MLRAQNSLERKAKHFLGELAVLRERLDQRCRARTRDRLESQSEDTGKLAVDNVVQRRTGGERLRLLSVVRNADNVGDERSCRSRRVSENDTPRKDVSDNSPSADPEPYVIWKFCDVVDAVEELEGW